MSKVNLLISIMKDAEKLVKELLSSKKCSLDDIPKSKGVYLVRNKIGDIIYIGKAVNLKRRICEDHCGGDEKMSTSTLRRSISKQYNIAPNSKIGKWIKGNCSFSYIIVEDHDTRDLVEALSIAFGRRSGNNLLNFYRR